MKILDNPIWSALTTAHRRFAEGGPNALRFQADVEPFIAMRESNAACLTSLAKLVRPDDVVMLLQREKIIVPEGLYVVETGDGVQMIADRKRITAPHQFQPLPLTAKDAAEMVELATLTKPGPFLAKTHELGEFWGIRQHGKLVAMAGERLKQPGYCELSGVCTHPDNRGQGLARKLSGFVANRIVQRGDTPYLHAYASNAAAINLYQTLGFTIRCQMRVAALARRS